MVFGWHKGFARKENYIEGASKNIENDNKIKIIQDLEC
jgi:hypothetical protein